MKVDGIWKVKQIAIIPLVTANYSTGWGNGTIGPVNTFLPYFLIMSGRSTEVLSPSISPSTNLTELSRRLARSAACHVAENQSGAYGYYLDDLQCASMGALHALNAAKESPSTGWFNSPSRITEACVVEWGNRSVSSLRSSISFHWRPQPVILVSEDGRSATLRARPSNPVPRTSAPVASTA